MCYLSLIMRELGFNFNQGVVIGQVDSLFALQDIRCRQDDKEFMEENRMYVWCAPEEMFYNLKIVK